MFWNCTGLSVLLRNDRSELRAARDIATAEKDNSTSRPASDRSIQEQSLSITKRVQGGLPPHSHNIPLRSVLPGGEPSRSRLGRKAPMATCCRVAYTAPLLRCRSDVCCLFEMTLPLCAGSVKSSETRGAVQGVLGSLSIRLGRGPPGHVVRDPVNCDRTPGTCTITSGRSQGKQPGRDMPDQSKRYREHRD